MRKLLLVISIWAQCALVIGALLGCETLSHGSEHHPRAAATVARWDSAGWQVQSDGTVFRTALDSRGQYTEVTCPRWGMSTGCTATADDGSHPSVPSALLREP